MIASTDAGGGIFCTNLGVVDFHSGSVQDNTAVRAGGGIYLEGRCRLLGRTPGLDRRVARNLVEDHQLGEGGGIYAFDAEI